jgi:hypothetical protein
LALYTLKRDFLVGPDGFNGILKGVAAVSGEDGSKELA